MSLTDNPEPCPLALLNPDLETVQCRDLRVVGTRYVNQLQTRQAELHHFGNNLRSAF